MLHLIFDICRGAVSYNIVGFVFALFKGGKCLGVFFVIRKLLLPYAYAYGAKLSVMAFCTAHGEKAFALDIEKLSSHKVDNAWGYSVYLSSMPVFYGISVQEVEILVIAVNKEGGERSVVKPASPPHILLIIVPYKSEISANYNVIILCHAVENILEVGVAFVAELMDIVASVDIACYKYHFALLLISSSVLGV